VIKSRHYIKKKGNKKNERKRVYNIRLVTRLIGTILYIGRAGLRWRFWQNLVEFGRVWQILQKLQIQDNLAVVAEYGRMRQIAAGGLCKVL
jgi:hypothetical protein